MNVQMVIFILKLSKLRKIPCFLSPHLPRTSHEYYLCILAMFTMSSKDVKHVNSRSLGVLNLLGPVGKALFTTLSR